MAAPKDIPKVNHEKFLSKISIDPISGCWNWIGAISKGGYGLMMVRPRTLRAHRISYDIFIGLTNLDLVIDHVCRNKKCCNPIHLREVSATTNCMENSIGIAPIRKKQTHCIHGHEFTKSNTIAKYGGLRGCRECKKRIDKNRNKVDGKSFMDRL